MKKSGNDVLDYSKYFNGKNEPPLFYRQIIDPKNKLFVPVDDLELINISKNIKQDVILHHFVWDKKQNKETFCKFPPIKIYDKVYAVCSKDLSVDSKNMFDCFNNSNILKSRIDAYRLQTEYDLLVILTLIWGDVIPNL